MEDMKLMLKNYFDGQIHDSDDNPAVPPTFKKKEKNLIKIYKI